MLRKALILLAATVVLLVIALGFLLWQAASISTDVSTAPPPQTLAGLDWLPAESGLVVGFDVAAIRSRGWMIDLLDRTSPPPEVEPEYKAFVGATGFDYARDLDRVWLGVWGPSPSPRHTAGVAEGRFQREKIIAYARSRDARSFPHAGIEILQVDEPIRDKSAPVRSFAFAFLDETHLAFGSDSERVAGVIDCWKQAAPSVGADADRRNRIEASAAGLQAWAVDDLSRWVPPWLSDQDSIRPLLREISAGLLVGETNLLLRGQARCHEPAQAERLHDNVKVLAMIGRVTLRAKNDPLMQGLADALGNLALKQDGDAVRAEITLTPDAMAQLLGGVSPRGTADNPQ